jgi:hypothetical protein
MKFNLRHVFMMLFWLSVGVSFSMAFETGRIVHHQYVGAINAIRDIKRIVDSHSQIEAWEVKLWLDPVRQRQRNQYSLESYIPFDGIPVYEYDPWGRPFHVVEPVKAGDEFHFYSSGQDGKSLSEGNDPDDLNTWDDHGESWYRKSIQRHDRMRLGIRGTVIGLGIFVMTLLLARISYTKPNSTTLVEKDGQVE